MPDIFTLDQRDLKKLMRFAKRAPLAFRRASAGVLNDQAFTTKKINFEQIARSMIIRNKGFVRSSLRVKPAKTMGSIAQQVAIAGSIRRPRFSGWDEPELNKESERERVATIAARGGSRRRQVKPSYRLKPGKKFVNVKKFPGKNFKSKYRNMMTILNSKGGKQPFILDRQYKAMKPGLYLLSKNKLSKLQDLKPSTRRVKKNRWMTRSLNVLRRSFDVRKSWIKQINRVLPKKL